MKFLNVLNLIIEGVGSHRNLPNIKVTVHNENILDVLDQFFVMRKIVEYANYLLEERRIVLEFNKNVESIINNPRIDKKSKVSLIQKERKLHEKITDDFRKKIFKTSFSKRKIPIKTLGKNVGPITINSIYNDKSEESENIRDFKKFVTGVLNNILNAENINLNQIKIDFIETINRDFPKIDPKIFNTYLDGDSKFKRHNFIREINVYVYNRNQLITDLNATKKNFSLIDSITHDLIFHAISDYDLFTKFRYDPVKKESINPPGGYSVKNWIKEFHAVYYSQIFDETDNHAWNFPRISNDIRTKVLLEMNLLKINFLDNLKTNFKNQINILEKICSKLKIPFEKKEYNEFSIRSKFLDIIDELNEDINFYNKKTLPFQDFFERHLTSMLKYIEKDKKKTDKSFIDAKITWEIFLEYIKDYKPLYNHIKNNPQKFPPKDRIYSLKTEEYMEDFFKILSKGITTTGDFIQSKDDYFDNFEATIDFFIEKVDILVKNINRLDNYNKYIKNKLVYEKN